MKKQRIDRFVAETIAAAKREPARAREIFVGAAHKLRRAAADPRNAKQAPTLLGIAREIVTSVGPAFEWRSRVTTDDFEQLEQRQAQAYDEAVNDPAGDLGVQARRQEIEAAEDSTFGVSIAPASITEGTRLGKQITIKSNPSQADALSGIVQSDTVALWQGTKREAQSVTADAAIVLAPAASITGNLSLRPYGIVQYGADGFTEQVKFDLGFGTRFTVAGSYVSLLLGMDPPAPGLVSASMTVGGSLAMFAAPSAAPPTLTMYVDGLAAGGTATVLRPNKGAFLLPPQSSDPAGTTRLDFYGFGGEVTSLVFANGTIVYSIPLCNTAQIVVTNQGANTASFRLPFQLAL